jgi:hypothetical protein
MGQLVPLQPGAAAFITVGQSTSRFDTAEAGGVYELHPVDP